MQVRVNTSAPGGVVSVDRGKRDDVRPGDQVFFFPRSGGIFEGRVLEVGERLSRVELLDRELTLPAGTRGEVLIPLNRREEQETPPPAAGERLLPWANKDEKWTPSMPLLAQIEAVRPDERPRSLTGVLSLDMVGSVTSEDDRSDFFLRLGQDLDATNPFGWGGELHVELEETYKSFDIDDTDLSDDENSTSVRVDRLSYTHGGTRFDEHRFEGGRFLQYGMPEFGLVDGVEYSRRLENGHTVGGSLGFMPEPDPDLESGDDFQVSGYYRWVADESEELFAAGGYQKTLHNGSTDRDLLVGKFGYRPRGAWAYYGTVWVDLYTSSDDEKDSPVELTQAWMTASRRFESGNGLNVTFRHLQIPEIDRDEFRPIDPDDLADDRRERLALSGWRWIGDGRRLHGDVGVWNDEDDTGADTSIGIDIEDVFIDGVRAGVTLFGADGSFSSVYGSRFSYGRPGRWDVMYELSQNDWSDFDVDSDDLLQHRVRATREVHLQSGWDLSMYGQGLFWDDESSWSLGVYLQHSF